MGFDQTIRRLRQCVQLGSEERRGCRADQVRVKVRDLVDLLADWCSMDAKLRVGHVLANPEAYPPRRDMIARAAADPAAFAGDQGKRTTAGWIADAVLAVEAQTGGDEGMAIDVAWMIGGDRPGMPATRHIDLARRIMALLREPPTPVPAMRPECPSSPDGRHQIDTSMEAGAANCFHCGDAMDLR